MIDPLTLATTYPEPTPPSKGEAATQDFEAMMVKVMLKEMRRTLPKDGMFASSAMDTFQDLFDEALAKSIAEKSPIGLGEHLTHAPSDPMPVNGRMTSRYGSRVDPITGRHRHHDGLDIAAPAGTPIRAVRGGTVVFAGERGGYGNLVEIDHGNGMTTRYAHCQDLLVRRGEGVGQGTRIATVGSTGRSTGPHLHLEVRRNGDSVDPLDAFGWTDKSLKSAALRADEPLGTRRK